MWNENIKKALKGSAHSNALLEVMDYAVLPAGKLFRPRLVEALSLDINGKLDENSLHLGCAIELHHAYTLVHDDLPSMDNDLVRRGKPSTHAHFGEWRAVLAGDALLIASFHELMKIRHDDIHAIHSLFSWATGAKGLILGQYLDLEADGNLPIDEVVRVHELKTARLIQIATLGVHILSRKNKNAKSTVEFFRLGREIGVTFQLLDDLGELVDSSISHHEKLINPFVIKTREALTALKVSHSRLKLLTTKHRLTHLDKMLNSFFKDGQSKLELGFQNVRSHVDRNVVSELEKWITTYV